ncbi:MAG: NAD-dependent epimerase/dehydratase family protein [bacterium]|nr:NAD-dependent epimerase/dehydratase family protein [bacterium]
MRVVVTGASGHVGANLVRALLDRGDEVRALVHRRSESLEGLDVEYAHGDVLDSPSLRAAFEGAERVYHLAALISIDGNRGGAVPAINVRGARNVAEAALDAGVGRLVHCSSIHAFDQEPLGRPLDEQRSRADERGGHPAYDVSKARGEREVRAVIERGLDAVIVNPTGIIGPNDFQDSRMGRVLLDLALRRLPSLIDGGFVWVDVRDVCDGLIAAGDLGRTGENYLLGGRHATVRELATLVEEETGVAPPRITSPMWLARIGAPFVVAAGRIRGSEPLYTGEALRALRGNRDIATTKARDELGFSPRPLDRTVRDTLDWYVATGRLPHGLLRPAAG